MLLFMSNPSLGSHQFNSVLLSWYFVARERCVFSQQIKVKQIGVEAVEVARYTAYNGGHAARSRCTLGLVIFALRCHETLLGLLVVSVEVEIRVTLGRRAAPREEEELVIWALEVACFWIVSLANVCDYFVEDDVLGCCDVLTENSCEGKEVITVILAKTDSRE